VRAFPEGGEYVRQNISAIERFNECYEKGLILEQAGTPQ
jgi:hypothetical protein